MASGATDGICSDDQRINRQSDGDKYFMKHAHRGYALIINNKKFKKHGERTGTDVDAKAMHDLLNELGFKDRITQKDDVSASGMKKLLKKASKKDFADSDCFVCVILTHGDQGIVCGSDSKPVLISHLIRPLQKCESLADKPIIFFIQACQGKNIDIGQSVRTEGDGSSSSSSSEGGEEEEEEEEEEDSLQEKGLRMPMAPDLLIAFSSVQGCLSWRDLGKGSWFIQALVDVLKKKHKDEDLLSMLIEVNRAVAVECEFISMKQMPCTCTMLTKKIYF